MKRSNKIMAVLLVVLVIGGFCWWQFDQGGLFNIGGKDTISSSGTADAPGQVRLVVSHDYGEQLLFDEWLAVAENALALTKLHLQVETDQGGSFVTRIEGVGGKDQAEQNAWFFYYNGALSSRGAGEVKLAAGDVVLWDYHSWANEIMSPAIIAALPHPFKDGGQLLYGQKSREAAADLSSALQSAGTGSLKLAALENNIPDRDCPTVVVGSCKELAPNPEIQELMKQSQQSGLFCRITEGGLQGINEQGKIQGPVYKRGSACIMATGSGWGEEQPLWIIAFTDQEGAAAAAHFIQSGVSPHFAWGVLITPQGSFSLPYIKK